MTEREGVREIRADDAPSIFSLIEQLRAASAVPIGPRWTEAQVREECVFGGWLLEDKDERRILAFVLVRDIESAWEISFLGTAIDSRGRGLMRALLGHIFSLRPPGRPIWLEVHELNEPARHLYETMGFIEVGRRPRYYADGGAARLYNYG